MSHCDFDSYDFEKVNENFFCQDNEIFSSESEPGTFFIEEETKATETFFSNDTFEEITEEIIKIPDKTNSKKNPKNM